jgi:hypothetical protein
MQNDEALKALESWETIKSCWSAKEREALKPEIDYIEAALKSQSPAPSVSGEVVKYIDKAEKSLIEVVPNDAPSFAKKVEALGLLFKIKQAIESHKPQAGALNLTPYERWRYITDATGVLHHVPDYELLKEMSELYYGAATKPQAAVERVKRSNFISDEINECTKRWGGGRNILISDECAENIADMIMRQYPQGLIIVEDEK